MAALRPNFSGSWSANIERSRFRMEPPRTLLMGIAHDEPEIRHKVLTTSKDGAERLAQLRYVVGQDIEAVIAGTPAVVKAQWRGLELVIESRLTMQGRDIRLADCWSLSPDGSTLTMEHRDDALAGQICVLERAPPDDTE